VIRCIRVGFRVGANPEKLMPIRELRAEGRVGPGFALYRLIPARARASSGNRRTRPYPTLLDIFSGRSVAYAI
jgi:hypothetical protein